MQGAVAVLISISLQIILPRNLPLIFFHRLRIDTITVMSLWSRFWPTLYRLFGPETGVNFFSFFVFAFPYMILALSTSWLMLVCVLVGPRLYYSRYLSWIVRPTSRIFHSSSGESLISLTELPFGLRARSSDAIFMRLLYWRRFCLPGTKTFSTIGSFYEVCWQRARSLLKSIFAG